jgi:hypothetical protein
LNVYRIPTAGNEPLLLLPEGMGSVLTGQAADKDRDFAAHMLLGGDIGKRAEAFISSREHIDAYQLHSEIMKTLKPKAPKMAAEMAEVPGEMLSRVAAEQMSMPQRYLPRLSVALTGMKTALSVLPASPIRQSALTVTELLEQLPVAGKHWSARQIAGEMENRGLQPAFEGLTEAIRLGDAPALQYHLEQMIGGPQRIAGSEQIQEALKKVNLKEVLPYMAAAQKQFTETPEARTVGLLTGRGSYIRPEELPGYLSKVGQALQGTETGVVTKVGLGEAISSKMLSVINKFAATGKGLLQHAKPLAIGAAASLGLATLLSRPVETVGSGSQLAAENPAPLSHGKAAQYRKPIDMQPPQGVISNPSPPMRLSVPTARVRAPMGHNANIQMKTNDIVNDPAALAQQCARAAGNTSNVNLSVQDRRSILNIDKILNDME